MNAAYLRTTGGEAGVRGQQNSKVEGTGVPKWQHKAEFVHHSRLFDDREQKAYGL